MSHLYLLEYKLNPHTLNPLDSYPRTYFKVSPSPDPPGKTRLWNVWSVTKVTPCYSGEGEGPLRKWKKNSFREREFSRSTGTVSKTDSSRFPWQWHTKREKSRIVFKTIIRLHLFHDGSSRPGWDSLSQNVWLLLPIFGYVWSSSEGKHSQTNECYQWWHTERTVVR